MNHRLVLTTQQSEYLDKVGPHFAVVTIGSYPDAAGLRVLHLVECSKEVAEAACSVALGEATARRLRVQSTNPE
ncbi:MAG: hypothetical protein JWO82_2114 [Akkermansiaceae bacterium]|nr:hypothetical protein [Akkermansiaceae bacterium]